MIQQQTVKLLALKLQTFYLLQYFIDIAIVRSVYNWTISTFFWHFIVLKMS
jgi:hypothetical protein